MSWWKKQPGPSAAGPSGEPAWPVELEVVPGELSARVYLHDIESQGGPIGCWSYVSHGLAALEQPEIVLTLRRDPGEASADFPQDPLRLFATLYQLAADGRRVGPGDVTGFGDRSFLGHHLLYVGAQPLDGVPLPPSCLAALLITADELRAVSEFGPTRVLARMGQASNYYPFPPWADRSRPGLSLARTFEESLLSKIPRAAAHDVRAGVEGNQIIVSALRGAWPPWQDRLAELADDVPLTLLTALDPTADGCLVWVPGQSTPEAITPTGSDGSRLCGCFVVFVPERSENGGRMHEDGFVVELTAASWKQLRSALIEATDVSMPAAGTAMSFALTWRDQEYVSPVDGRSYTAEGGWDAYQPTTERAQAASRVTINQVRLLTSEREMAARTSVDELAAFCQEVARCAQHTIGDHDDATELLIRLRCTCEGHDVELASRGDVSQPFMQALVDAVQQMARLPVQDGEVSFEIELTVSHGD
jgi:hypothetical protein